MGRIICCGLGPGNPDLMSVRADREIRAATQVAYFRKKGRPGQARRIVDGMLAMNVHEYPMEYPVTTELAFDSEQYARALASFPDIFWIAGGRAKTVRGKPLKKKIRPRIPARINSSVRPRPGEVRRSRGARGAEIRWLVGC